MQNVVPVLTEGEETRDGAGFDGEAGILAWGRPERIHPLSGSGNGQMTIQGISSI